MLSLIFGNKTERQKLALQGKVSFRPLYFIMVTLLIVSYLSSFFYSYISGRSFSNEVIDLGMRYVPAVAIASSISNNPDVCRFTMSTQWVLSIFYMVTLIIGYCPFTAVMKVAAHRASLIKPVSYMSLRGLGFVLFGSAYILGDFGVTRFPTLFNGVYFSGEHPLALFLHIVNSPLFMPLFSWISAFVTVMFYWMCLYVIANYNFILGLNLASE